MVYTGTVKYEQRHQSRKDKSQALELNKGMGIKPRIDQYRECLGPCPLVKASHWEFLLRRQGRSLLRHEPGDLLYRQNVIKNGYGDIQSSFRGSTVAIIFIPLSNCILVVPPRLSAFVDAAGPKTAEKAPLVSVRKTADTRGILMP